MTKSDFEGEFSDDIKVEISYMLTCRCCLELLRKDRVPRLVELEDSVYVMSDGVSDSPMSPGRTVGKYIGQQCKQARRYHNCLKREQK